MDCGSGGGAVDAVEEGDADYGGEEAEGGGEEDDEAVEGGGVADLVDVRWVGWKRVEDEPWRPLRRGRQRSRRLRLSKHRLSRPRLGHG